MTVTNRLACVLSFGVCAFAQSEEPGVVVNVDHFSYPALAKSASIQGDVVFEVTTSGQKLVLSASPVLALAAETNLATWTLPPLKAGRYVVVYKFELSDQETEKKDVPIGNKFDRLLLRLFHAPTTRAVYSCVENRATEFRVERNAPADGDDYLILVSVRRHRGCLNTEVSQVALNSNL